jgi:DUF1707 SHOCT-like domain
MSASSSPSSPRGYGSRRRASYVNPDLRISDADRAEVADRLSKHYGDGRLDQAEFDARLDQAMKAKTQADLTGLFADLPGTEPAGEVQRRPHMRLPRLVFLVLVIVFAAMVGHALMHFYIPWLLIGLLAFLWLWRGPWHQHRR